jgi:hypothetical protein
MRLTSISIFIACLICSPLLLSAQITQVIRGKIVDKESKFPLIGATVFISNDTIRLGAAQSDENGVFKIPNIRTGRHKISITYVGYKDLTMENIIVDAGKEVILNIEMEESVVIMEEAVVITATRFGETVNEMAVISSRPFSIEETERYAGSRGDPARMASNFAGVQGADDSRNDIVIRGNSPAGVVWRFEGIDIFNPNHFNIPGTTGSPVTILNNKWLSTSDFFTSAFPAEYGNGISGVFDLRMRNGNNEKLEFSGQLGVLGTELLVEGPLSKKSGASYLASFRYSTLALVGNLGLSFGTDAIPRYGDAAIRLNFPLKNNATLALFAVGGKSDVDIIISDQKEFSSELYGSNDRDQYFHSKMGFGGITYSKSFNTNTYTKATFVYSRENVSAEHDLVFRHIGADQTFVVDSLPRNLSYNFGAAKISLGWFVNHKLSKKLTLKAGLNVDSYAFDFRDTVRVSEFPNLPNGDINPDYNRFVIRWDARENAFMFRPYVNFKYQPTDRLTFTAGLHHLSSNLGKATAIAEPRFGMRYELAGNSAISLGAGLHSQVQSPYLYYYRNRMRSQNDPTEYNLDLGLTKSLHLVAGWQKLLGQRTLLKFEVYYQKLFNAPVDAERLSSFSLLNTGSGFSRFFPDRLENTGTGRNYGVELTIEKGFSNHFYYMVSTSLYDATYVGSNGVRHNSDFNGQYIANGIFGYEWVLSKKQSINLGTKITTAGGHRYGDIDTLKTQTEKEVIYKDNDNYNEYRFKSYFRADLKVNYKINAAGMTHEIGIDIVNLLDTKNILRYSWVPLTSDPSQGTTREEYQLGRLPLVYYKVDF